MNKKKLLCIVLCIVVISIVLLVVLLPKDKKEQKDNTVVNHYVAYVKINPSVKLEYSETCTKNDDGTLTCEKPVVDKYELINEDAKDIFKDVNLLSEGSSLDKVIKKICETAKKNNIDVKTVEVTSDWEKIDDYVANNVETTEEVNYTVEVSDTAKIETAITEEIKEEEYNKTTTTTTTKKTTTTTTTKKTTTTTKSNGINLSDNVKYSHSMVTYGCDGCFSDSLIKSLKSTKGVSVVSSSSSEITVKYITKLSDPYNTSKYYSNSIISKISEAGGEEMGGAGGSDDELTKSDCSEFNLTCN